MEEVSFSFGGRWNERHLKQELDDKCDLDRTIILHCGNLEISSKGILFLREISCRQIVNVIEMTVTHSEDL